MMQGSGVYTIGENDAVEIKEFTIELSRRASVACWKHDWNTVTL